MANLTVVGAIGIILLQFKLQERLKKKAQSSHDQIIIIF